MNLIVCKVTTKQTKKYGNFSSIRSWIITFLTPKGGGIHGYVNRIFPKYEQPRKKRIVKYKNWICITFTLEIFGIWPLSSMSFPALDLRSERSACILFIWTLCSSGDRLLLDKADIDLREKNKWLIPNWK